jgi:hypothetical protein
MYHYLYTKEGIADIKGIDASRVAKYEKKAIEKGYKPSRVIGGIRYFDYDELFMLNDPPIIEAIKAKREKRKKVVKKTQLSFYDLNGFF